MERKLFFANFLRKIEIFFDLQADYIQAFVCLPANKVNSAILAAIRVLNLVLSSRETDGLDRLPSGQIVFLPYEKKIERKIQTDEFKRILLFN